MREVTIVMTTYAPLGKDGEMRKQASLAALLSWKQHIRYPRNALYLHVADDGSPPEMEYTYGYWAETFLRVGEFSKFSYSQQWRKGVGASLNAGFRQAFETGDYALYAVDDWALASELDLRPWVKLLEEDRTIGAVRLGPPHPWLSGRIEFNTGQYVMRLERHHFAASFRPTLYHRRYWEAYGEFPEDCSSLESERLHNEYVNSHPGPDIVLACLYPWEHIETVELSALQP